MRRILVLIGAMLTGVSVYAQAPTIQVWIAGDVIVTTSNSLTLTSVRVRGRMWRDDILSGERDVVFCVTHAKPIASKLNYRGQGKVVYRMVRSGRTRSKGPPEEKMSPALGVVKMDGETLFFLAEGQSYPHAPNERSIGHISTFGIVKLVMDDGRDLEGDRQKTDISSCVESKR